MGVYTNNLSGVPVGLGMPEPADKHWRIANFYTRYCSFLQLPFEAGTESPTGKNKKYRVVDFAVTKFKKGGEKEILFFIEICHKDTYKDALKRTLEILQKNKSLKECFIFQYDSKKFEKIINKNMIINTAQSDFLGVNLWDILKDFYDYVMKTS